jgi:hypothetical protein
MATVPLHFCGTVEHNFESLLAEKQTPISNLCLKNYLGIPLTFIFNEFQIGGFSLGHCTYATEEKQERKKNPVSEQNSHFRIKQSKPRWANSILLKFFPT